MGECGAAVGCSEAGRALSGGKRTFCAVSWADGGRTDLVDERDMELAVHAAGAVPHVEPLLGPQMLAERADELAKLVPLAGLCHGPAQAREEQQRHVMRGELGRVRLHGAIQTAITGARFPER